MLSSLYFENVVKMSFDWHPKVYWRLQKTEDCKRNVLQAMSELDNVSIHDSRDVGVSFNKYKSK